MNDVLDSYYAYISDAYTTLNPSRILAGMVNAQDWPQVEIQEGALYLLYLTSVEVPEMGSRSQAYFEHYLQWSWVYLGTDIQAGQVGANRSDRFRSSMAIVEELRQVSFPGFCPKQQIAIDPVTGTPTFTPYNPVEMLHWSTPRLGTKLANAQSGISYSTAPFEVYGWSSVNPLVNV